MIAGPSWPLVDIGCVLLLVVYGLSGLRGGFIATAGAVCGFLAGGALGLLALPHVRDLWPTPAADVAWAKGLGLLAVTLLIAVLGQLLGGILGRRLRASVTAPGLLRLDSLLGLVAAVITTATALWLVAGVARVDGNSPISRAVGRSVVLSKIDSFMPSVMTAGAQRVRSSLAQQGFPQVFEGLRSEPVIPVQAPNAQLSPTAADTVARSVVRIDGDSPRCGVTTEGSGWVYAPEHIATNAHVVAGTRQVQVTAGGEVYAATVVVFDPVRDVAVLDVPGLPTPVLSQGRSMQREQLGAVAGYPLAGDYTLTPVRVRDELSARGWDIYSATQSLRQIYALRGEVHPGNSGGPLVDAEGRAVGMVFARSVDDAETGYALTLAEMAQPLVKGKEAQTGVDTRSCVG